MDPSQLLEWSTKHSTGAPVRKQEFPKELVDKIFGKSTAEILREKYNLVMESTGTERLTAIQDFELDLESIDNSISINKLKMWPSLISLLQNSEKEIQNALLSLFGTAAQNNSLTQSHLMEHGLIQSLVSLDSSGIEKKLLFCVSSMIATEEQLKVFYSLDGMNVIADLKKCTYLRDRMDFFEQKILKLRQNKK